MKWLRYLILFFTTSCASHHYNTVLLKAAFDKQGHRGCRGLMPENTTPAMLKAIDLGVTTLEMDAVITSDSQVLLSHEPFFSHELTTQSDGSFVTEATERSLNIYKMTYEETKKFDVGLKPHPRFPAQQKMAVSKPRLSDVIDSVEQYVKLKKLPPVAYNIETKSKAITDGLFHPEPDTFVRLLVQVIEQKGIGERVTIQSFDVRTLQVVHRSYPGYKTSLLIEEGDTKTFEEQLRILGFTPAIYSPHYTLVNAALIAACKNAGVKLLPWTVNNKDKIAELKKLGVDGIITDYPDLFAGME
jgi:glycerophosphoryl diester phosphodiesterase